MKTALKGLIVGGAAGIAVGAAIDVSRRGSEVPAAGARVAALAPKAADRLRSVASTGATKLHETDLSHVTDLGKDLEHRLADSDVGKRARETLGKATKKSAELAHSLKDAVPSTGS